MPDLLDRLKTALSDRYAIEDELGAGGMATVYLAEDLKHKRQVAIKVLRPELAMTLGVDRFGESGTIRELHALTGISTDNIVNAALLVLHNTVDG